MNVSVASNRRRRFLVFFVSFALLLATALANDCGNFCKCKKLGEVLGKTDSEEACIDKCMRIKTQDRYKVGFLNRKNENTNEYRCKQFCRRARHARAKVKNPKQKKKRTTRRVRRFCRGWTKPYDSPKGLIWDA